MTLIHTYSMKLLASSPIPQESTSLGLAGLSSSLVVFRLRLLLLLPVPAVPLLLILPGLKPEPLPPVLCTLSEYSGGPSEGPLIDVRPVSSEVFRVGVGDGVISVDGDISTNSASRYHFLRLV